MNEEQDQKSIQLRALLAFALSAAVLFLYQYLMVQPAPPRPPAVADAPVSEPATRTPPATAEPVPAAKPAVSAPPVSATAAAAEQTVIVETATYLVAFSNKGGVVTSWTLKAYQDDAGKPLELVNAVAGPETGFPFRYEGARQQELNQALFQIETSPAAAERLTAPATVTFRWSDGRLQAEKTFRFAERSYVVEITSSVSENGQKVPHRLSWQGGFGDAALATASQAVKTLYYDRAQQKVVRVEASDAKSGPVMNAGSFLYAGIEDLYFAALFMPADGAQRLELETSAAQVATARQEEKQLYAGAAIGSETNHFRAFVGPKNLDILKAVQPELAEIVDFGFFKFIAYPLFLMLNWVNGYVHNFGWAIIVVTVIINFLLFPLKLKSMKSMKKMQQLQPLIKHINDKYKNIPLRDPRKQEQNQEVMALYSRYGVNPLGGCLPMLLQMPFFFAFYSVLTVSIEMRNAAWLWVRDLSSPEDLAIRILPLAMIGTQFWYQKMTPTTTADPAQQRMMQFMPLVMGFFFYGLSSGLVLYWLTGNLVGIAQQWFINRLPEPALELEPPKKGKSKKPKS